MSPGSGPPTPPFDPAAAYPRFSQAEMQRRWAAVRELLAEAGADALVVTGHAASRNEVQYLTNAPVRWESWLVATGDLDDARLHVQLFNHVPTMAAWSTVDTTWAGSNPVATVAARLRERGADRGGIALLGPVSARAMAALRAALPDARLIDMGAAFIRHRLVKSADELAWMAYGAALCDYAVATFVAEARPGMGEDQLTWLLESGHARIGGQGGICFLMTAPMAGGGAVVPAQVPSRRRTGPDDIAVFELSAGFGGYTGQVLRTVALGGPPSAVVRDLHAVADETFDALLAAIRPGVTAAEIEAVGGMVDRAGLTIVDDLVHGYGGGYLPPVLRTPAARHVPPPDLELRPGMCLVLQPNIVSVDGRHGVQTGELVVITETGARSLHRAPRGLLRVASAG